MTPTTVQSITSSPARHLLAAERKASQGGAADQGALRVLTDGQTVVHWLLARFSLLRRDAATHAQARGGVVRRLCAELAVHMHVEEELLYPRLREQVSDTALIDQAEIEHECLRDQMDRLMDMHPDDPRFEARVTVLAELFDVHVQRELAHLLPLLRDLDLRTLGRRMADRRDLMLAELADRQHGLRFENEEADPVGEPAR